MRKRFLTRMNVVLGALSLGLAGCGSCKKASAPQEPQEPRKYGPPTEVEVIEKYGILPYVDEPRDEPTQAPDTVAPEPEPIPVLYGPPPGWDDELKPVPDEEEPIKPAKKKK